MNSLDIAAFDGCLSHFPARQGVRLEQQGVRAGTLLWWTKDFFFSLPISPQSRHLKFLPAAVPAPCAR
jgi:hypothetical protein